MSHNRYIECINKVQNKIFKIASFGCGVNLIYLKSLTERRVDFDVTFIFKLLISLHQIN